MFRDMNITSYRKEAGISQATLAEMLSKAGYPATQTLVSHWETGAVRVSAERAAQLEAVTKGGIRRSDLRPDLFGDLPQAANDDGEAA